MINVMALFSGLLFGFGLAFSGMTDPANVQGFLDVFGTWQPGLMLVMVGALLVTTLGFFWVLKRPSPLIDSQFYLPLKTAVDKKLIMGAIIFGIGWGLSGFCPGPALASLVYGFSDVFYFVAAMIVGIGLENIMSRRA